MNDTIDVGSITIHRMDYKARFTGKALPTFATCSIVDGHTLVDGHYEALTGEIFNVFSIECEDDQYIGLQAQVDHDNNYLILSIENYNKYIETDIFSVVDLT